MKLDLGLGHLSLDAVVAYIDGNLSPSSFRRACAHLAVCDECASEVSDQLSARALLRHAGCPPVPEELVSRLRAIPTCER